VPWIVLHVFALADKKVREAMAEVVEAESLTRLQRDANLNRGGAPLPSHCIYNVDTERVHWQNVDTMYKHGGLAV
jgi:hypothetical protein